MILLLIMVSYKAIIKLFIEYIDSLRDQAAFIVNIFVSLRLGDPKPRKAEWIIFFEKRVLFEWFRDR